MSRRKLAVLDYAADVVDYENEDHLRELIVWLEDQYICLYKIDDRCPLRSPDSAVWRKAVSKYLTDLKCPLSFESEPAKEIVDWLLDCAISNRSVDNIPNAEGLTSAKLRELRAERERKQKANDPISALDFHSEDFKKGIEDLRQILGLGLHPNSDAVLKAACKFIVENLSDKAIGAANAKVDSKAEKPKVLPLSKLDMGMTSTKNGAVDAAVRALRLIHLQNLREVQTEINEVIVAVQEVTADPKTDKRLGKVGF